MKKIIALLIVAVMCLGMLVSCGNDTPKTDGLQDARDYLFAMYKDDSASTGVDYTVVNAVTVDGVKYPITWTVAVEIAAYNGAVEVVKGDTKDTIHITVDKPDKDIKYTLTATIADAKGNTKTIDFAKVIPMFAITTYDEWVAGCKSGAKGELVDMIIRAYVIAVVSTGSSSAGSMYLQDADGHGYYAYNPTLELEYHGTTSAEKDAELAEFYPQGTEVLVYGTGTLYGGQFEFNKGCQVVKTGNMASAPLVPNDATAAFAAAESQKDESLAVYQNALATLKDCTLTTIDGSYYYFTIGDKKVKYNLYDTYYFLTDAERKQITDCWQQVGYVADITGIVSCYSNSYQIYPITGDAVVVKGLPELGDKEAVDFEAENLTIDIAYSKNTSFELPLNGQSYGKVSIVWTSDNDCVVIDGGKVTVTLPSVKTVVNITATLTCGTEKVDVIFPVTVEAADTTVYTVEEVIKFMANYTAGQVSDRTYTVAGIVSSSSYNEKYGSYTIWLAAGDELKAFELYSVKFADGLDKDEFHMADGLVGTTVVCSGYLQLYFDSKNNVNIYEMPYLAGDKNPTGAAFTPLLTEEPLIQLDVKHTVELLKSFTAGQISETKFLVAGIVTSSSYNEKYGSYTIWLTDGVTEKAFELYSVAIAEDKEEYHEADALVGANVLCSGFLQLYVDKDGNNIYEMPYLSASKSPTGENFTPTVKAVKRDIRIYTVDELIALMADYTSGQVSEGKYTVYGKVVSSSFNEKYSSYTIWLENEAGEKAFELYSVGMAEDKAFYHDQDALAGCYVMCEGFIELYGTTYEMPYLAAKSSPTGENFTPTISMVELGQLSVARVIEITKKLGAGEITPDLYTVKGEVASSSYNEKYKSYTIWLKNGDDEQAFELYSVSITEDSDKYHEADALAGFTVACTGYLQHYVNSNGLDIYEMPYLAAKNSPTGENFTPEIFSVEK